MGALCGSLTRLWGQWSAPHLDAVGKLCPDVVNSTSRGFRKAGYLAAWALMTRWPVPPVKYLGNKQGFLGKTASR